jgi:hypothetical protein
MSEKKSRVLQVLNTISSGNRNVVGDSASSENLRTALSRSPAKKITTTQTTAATAGKETGKSSDAPK